MKFSQAVVLSLAFGGASAFAPVTRPSVSTGAITLLASAATEEAEQAAAASAGSKKDDRLRMMKSPRFHRRGFKEVRDDAEKRLEDEYMSDLVKDLRTSNYVMEKDGVKVYLAKVRKIRDVNQDDIHEYSVSH